MMTAGWHFLAVATAALVVVEGAVLLGVLRQLGAILVAVGPAQPGVGPGAGPTPGWVIDLDVLEQNTPAVAVFLSPRCQYCPTIRDAIPIVRRRYRELLVLPVVLGDDDAEAAAYAHEIGGAATTDLERLAEEWAIPGTPFAVGIGADHRARVSGIVNNLPQLETIIAAAIAPIVEPEGSSIQSNVNGGRSADELAVTD